MGKILSKLFDSSGRTNRLVFFYRHFGIVLCSIGLLFTIDFINDIEERYNALPHVLFRIIFFVIILCCVILLVLTVVNLIRRLHDLNCRVNFWRVFLLYFFFPYGIYLFFAKGTIGPNKYGPDPLQKNEIIPTI